MGSGYYGNISGGCLWYGNACPEKKCDGNGFVRCKVRTRGIVMDKIEGEYKKIRAKNSEPSQVHCLCLLEKKVANSRIGISA